jgi:hypothetical protein
MNAGVTLHVETLYGDNNHHIAESCFKGLARALRAAVEIDPRRPKARCRRPRDRSIRAESAAYGLEHHRPAQRRHPLLDGIPRPGRTGCTPISCMPITWSPARPAAMSSPSPTMAGR